MQWLKGIAVGSVNEAARALVARHLAITSRAAQTLVGLQVNGIPLSELADWTATRFSADGPVHRWAVQLTQLQPVIPGRRLLSAARQGIAAGVLAYRMVASGGDNGLARLRANLPTLLASCGPPGVLAARPALEVGTLADRLADLLMAADNDTDA
jgi:hypothetical protein